MGTLLAIAIQTRARSRSRTTALPAAQPAAASAHAAQAGSHRRSAQQQVGSGTRRRGSAGECAGKAAGGVALGASDITGNKELPKVMVIVPWKDSLGAGGVIKPTDSLMDEVLQPVDRGVFQRQIRYYGQLDTGAAAGGGQGGASWRQPLTYRGAQAKVGAASQLFGVPSVSLSGSGPTTGRTSGRVSSGVSSWVSGA